MIRLHQHYCTLRFETRDEGQPIDPFPTYENLSGIICDYGMLRSEAFSCRACRWLRAISCCCSACDASSAGEELTAEGAPRSSPGGRGARSIPSPFLQLEAEARSSPHRWPRSSLQRRYGSPLETLASPYSARPQTHAWYNVRPAV